MSVLKTVKLNALNMLVFAITGMIFLIGSISIHTIKGNVDETKLSLEEHWRSEARASLKNTINVFSEDAKKEIVDPYSLESVEEWADINFSGVRNGSTGSKGWIGEIGKEIMVSDQSILSSAIVDKIKYPRHFKDDYKLYDDPKQAKYVYDQITKGYRTTYIDNLSWSIDGNTEWVEFKYYPEYSGLDGHQKLLHGVSNPEYTRYVFLMKTNANEIYSKYDFSKQQYTIVLVYVTMIISFISSLCIMIIVLLKNNPVKDGGIIYERG